MQLYMFTKVKHKLQKITKLNISGMDCNGDNGN